MKTAIYTRVSTDNQEREGTSLQTQLENCLTYCQDKGYDVSYRFSEAYSGLCLERPELDKLRELVRAERIDVVVCYCLDRISRNATHGVILRDELDKHHVMLESVTEDIDKTPLGEAITYLRITFSQIEAEKIRERTMRGKLAKVREGQLPHGCGIGLYGYNWDTKTKKRIPNSFEAPVAVKIFTMMAEGPTVTGIARTLNEEGIRTKTGNGKRWCRQTIERMITNKSYIGVTTYLSTELPGITPPIIDTELFEQANESLKHNKELRKGRPKQPYLLTGHIVCGKCGKPLVGTRIRETGYYRCSGAKKNEYQAKSCNAYRIRSNVIDAAVWQKVAEAIMEPDLLLHEVRSQIECEQKQDNRAELDKEITKLNRKMKSYISDERSLLSLFRHREIDRNALLDEINQLKADREKDERRLVELTHSKQGIANLLNTEIKISEYCSTIARNLSNCSYEDKRLALDAFAIKLVATPEHFEISGILPVEVGNASANVQSLGSPNRPTTGGEKNTAVCVLSKPRSSRVWRKRILA